MKYLIIILITLFSCCINLLAQCPEGDVTLSTQQEIDNFSSTYPGCTELLGNLRIEDADNSINNLNGLAYITSITGDLVVSDNHHLTNLTGLESLTSMEGGIRIRENIVLENLTGLGNISSTIDFLSIVENDKLTSLTELENVASIEEYLYIAFNPMLVSLANFENTTSLSGGITIRNNALTTLAGLENISSIGGGISLQENHALTNLEGFSGLTSVGKDISIWLNGSLSSLDGLENLTVVDESFCVVANHSLMDISSLGNLNSVGQNPTGLAIALLEFRANSALESLVGLENLTELEGLNIIGNNISDLNGLNNLISITDLLYIENNESLETLNGLENLASVGRIRIRENDILQDISALNDIDYQIVNHLKIEQNYNLSNCSIESICNYLYADETHIIQYNNTGCDNTAEVLEACDTPDDCSIASLILETQTSIDDFAVNYPNCTEIGNLTIEGTDISNLNGLSQITSIHEDLIIMLTNIQSLSGLENLHTVHGDLKIGRHVPNGWGNDAAFDGNPNLTDLTALDNLTTLDGSLSIVANESLTSLEGIGHLDTIGGLYIYGNHLLPNLNDLANLEAVNGDLHIGKLDRLAVWIPGWNVWEYEWLDGGNNILTDLSGLEGLNSVEGTLAIVGNNGLNNLTGLHNIETVGGMNIYGNNVLNNFAGLGNLKTITGDFELFGTHEYYQEDIFGFDYAKVERTLGSNTLTSFAGLDSLTTIEGSLRIADNNALTNLSGLEALTHVGGDVVVGQMDASYIYDWFYYEPSGNDALVSLSGLENLTSIGGKLKIAANENLPNCMGLDNLQTTGGLQVYENPTLVNLSGLESLTHIEGDLELYYERWETVFFAYSWGNNDAMTSLEGLENLNSINGEIKIATNDILTNLTALDSLDYTSIQNILIVGNQNLSACNAHAICNYLDAGGSGGVSGNAPGCVNIEEIQASCEGQVLPCPTENFVFETQQELNDFVAQYSHCTELMGNVNIGRPYANSSTGLSTIDDLTPLNNINTIHGNLTINNNAVLSDLEGLSGLKTIGGNLSIFNNTGLVTLNGLDSLETIDGGLKLGHRYVHTIFGGVYTYAMHRIFMHYEGNDVLADISALSNIDTLEHLMVIGNPGLTDLSGLDNLTTINNDFFFIENHNVVDFSGLENLTHVGNDLTIGRIETESVVGGYPPNLYKHYYEGNDNLSSLAGLNNLAFVGGDFTIGDNDVMTNIDALTQLQSIGGDFNFYENNQIPNLSGLSGLTSIGGNLEFAYKYYNDYYFYINNTQTGNHALTDLTGLENLSSINGEIFIAKNTALTNLNALNNLDHTSITNLTLAYNGNLSVCDATSICNYLENDGQSEIFSNATGCNNTTQIENACDTPTLPCPQGDVTFTTQQEVDNFAIQYPNCTEITGNLRIGGTNDQPSVINDLTPLSQLTSIQGKLTIIKNDILTNLSGLENLTTIGSDIYIGSNPALSNLADWTGLTSIGGRLIIRNNALNDLTDFNSLTSIGGYINIGPDTLLTSLTGLENLTSINGYLYVHDNITLNNLNGLDNIDHTTITDLRILNNPQLSVCDVSSICNYLENDGTADINNNASGCNTQVEVQNNCNIVSVETPSNADFVIAPNPNKGAFTVNGIPQGTYQIHDTAGRIIQSGNVKNDLSIDISQEVQGIYFMSIQMENETITKRIIKM